MSIWGAHMTWLSQSPLRPPTRNHNLHGIETEGENSPSSVTSPDPKVLMFFWSKFQFQTALLSELAIIMYFLRKHNSWMSWHGFVFVVMSDTVESEERRLSDSESDQIWEENIYMSGCNVRSVGGLGGREDYFQLTAQWDSITHGRHWGVSQSLKGFLWWSH